MAPYNGTAMAPRPLHPSVAPWCHVQSAKVVRRPPPLLEVRTPIAVAIWGKKYCMMCFENPNDGQQMLTKVLRTECCKPSIFPIKIHCCCCYYYCCCCCCCCCCCSYSYSSCWCYCCCQLLWCFFLQVMLLLALLVIGMDCCCWCLPWWWRCC